MRPILTVKELAPDFTLSDASGSSHSLHDHTGSPVVLIFYPGDMTPGCTMQLCAIRDQYTKFVDAHITVFGINPASAISHTTFQTKHHFPFPLLVDKGSKVAKMYGAVRQFLGLTLIRRTIVIISGDGHIVFYKHGMPKESEILKAARLAA